MYTSGRREKMIQKFDEWCANTHHTNYRSDAFFAGFEASQEEIEVLVKALRDSHRVLGAGQGSDLQASGVIAETILNNESLLQEYEWVEDEKTFDI